MAARTQRLLTLRGASRGQASVELVALLPLVAVLAALLWQAVIAAQAVWLSAGAARAAARASAIGGDARAAAARGLPARLRRGLVVERDGTAGNVRVLVAVPAVVGSARLTTISARASFEAQVP